MIVEIELERNCKTCKGAGVNRLSGGEQICWQCNGLQQEITTEGRSLIQFLAKYYDIIPLTTFTNGLGTFDNPARDYLQ